MSDDKEDQPKDLRELSTGPAIYIYMYVYRHGWEVGIGKNLVMSPRTVEANMDSTLAPIFLEKGKEED